jgi:hypothetical protein
MRPAFGHRRSVVAALSALLATGCVSPGLDGLTGLECGAATDCAADQACVAGACVSRGEETCDGADNDGDGRIDEDFDFDDSLAHCGGCDQPCAGRCVSGTCDEGDLGLQGDAGCVPSDEVCDGLDNNCDGATDEGVLNACGTCGPVPEETCDGQDNDCDDAVDEDLPICRGSCVIPPEAPCNGIDDDCDGNTDDAMEPPEGCGACVEAEVACDGEDEDCDGTPDDGLLNACMMCGDVPAEVCNGLDDDCNGEVDETFPAPPTPCSAGEGACNRAGEYVCRAPAGSGTTIEPECQASPGAAELERCGNAIDDDCDGTTDEGFDGQIGLPCEVGAGLCFASGMTICNVDGVVQCDAVEGEPRPETCDLLDNNCDGQVDETYDLRNDAENCGFCNVRCMANHAATSCVAGECVVGDCQDGFLDIDRNPANGCECEPRADDEPDAAGEDSNCDGVDGTAALSVFVSADRGDDCTPGANPDPCPGVVPGTLQAPVRTLARALALTAERGLTHIILEQGDYTRNTAFTFDRDLELHGGYRFDIVTRTWSRPADPATPTALRAGRVRGEPAVVVSADVALTLDNLTIEATAAGEGQSAIAIRGDACGSIHLVRSIVIAGAGGSGTVGTPAVLAPDAATVGTDGEAGADARGNPQGAGGPGGTNPACPVGTAGGRGGQGGVRDPEDEGRRVGEPGGVGGIDIAGGEGALLIRIFDPLGVVLLVDTQNPAQGGADALPSPAGEPGVPGSPGGTVGQPLALWTPHAGTRPLQGVHGQGGGGGGGGVAGSDRPDLPGPGGGGGGAGACGGAPGGNGFGGGASIGVLVSGACLLRLEGSEVRTAAGGNGGNGSAGLSGGRGLRGGSAGLQGSTGPDELQAGIGGRGGNGGCGGSGAGGNGGPSIAILRVGGAPLPELDPASFVSFGAGGLPGEGATPIAACRATTGTGSPGLNGVATDVGCCVDPNDCGPDLACNGR